MAFQRPTLQELIDRITADLISRLELESAPLRRAVVKVLARVIAGAIHLVYGYLDFILAQIFPDISEEAYLIRQASLYGVEKKPGTFAGGLATDDRDVIFTGTNGTEIPELTRLQREDGILYEVVSAGTIAIGTATVPVRCLTAGAIGNCDADTILSLVSPISGIDQDATVDTGGITGGFDAETVEQLRARFIERLRNPPAAGTESDYIRWAKEVVGVTRAWAIANRYGSGTVGILFVVDGEMDIIPTAPKVAEVQAYIDERKPITADATVYAPTGVEMDFTIAVTPNTTAVKDAVEAELEDLLRREAEPGVTILLSHINEAISLAAGETDHALTVPAADVTHGTDEIPIMGTITWA